MMDDAEKRRLMDSVMDGDVELPVRKISIYQSDPGWEVIECHGYDDDFHVYENPDSEFYSTKRDALSAARELFRSTPTAAILDMGMARDFGRRMKIVRSRRDARHLNQVSVSNREPEPEAADWRYA